MHSALANLSDTAYGRTLIGDSLMFHIIFAAVGVGLPILICLAELIGRWRHNEAWLANARSWSRVLVVMFVAGAISGTLISFQFGLVWPQFMAIAGQVLGSAFFLEGIGFLIEAIFLSVYILTWKRLSGWWHWATSLPIVAGSLISAFFITTVNAWMNAPQGFAYDGHTVSQVNPGRAIFNPATATETSHSILAYVLMVAALAASWYALKAWRGRSSTHERQLLTGLATLILVLAGTMGLTGDASAKYLAHYEPTKLAAAEALFHTQSHAPLQIGGIISNGVLHGALSLSGWLSWLAYGRFDAVVVGLDSVARPLWPPLFVHYAFDGMVGIGMALGLIPILFLVAWWRRRPWTQRRALLGLMLLTGPLAVMAVELGWLLTELGRQPYAIRGVLTTHDAITTSPTVIHAAVIFPCLYLGLMAATIAALRHTYRTSTIADSESP